jgi:nucleotide-binding universal stress UspA family protein
MFDNVVVGVGDDQPARDALSLAKELISTDGKLLLIYVLPPEPGGDPESQAAERRRALARLALLRDEAQVDAELLCVEARSVAGALHEAVRARGDLLVIGASRRDEFEQVVVGNPTRAVLADSPSPVAVAPAGYATNPSELTKVGVAYDGSAESEHALAVARQLAREHDAELSAFEAVGEPIPHDPRNIDARPVDRAGEARARLADLGDDVEPAAATGDAADELARYAASVDLLVVGPHKHRPFDRLMGGSTSQRVTDRAPSPLLVLSSAGRVAGARA